MACCGARETCATFANHVCQFVPIHGICACGRLSLTSHHGMVDESVPTITTKLPPGVTRAGVSSHQCRSGRLLAPPGGWVVLLDAGPPVRETHWGLSALYVTGETRW